MSQDLSKCKCFHCNEQRLQKDDSLEFETKYAKLPSWYMSFGKWYDSVFMKNGDLISRLSKSSEWLQTWNIVQLITCKYME